MADGWKCPVCGRGVAPSERYCDHGQNLYGPAIKPHPQWAPNTSAQPPYYAGTTTYGVAYSDGRFTDLAGNPLNVTAGKP